MFYTSKRGKIGRRVGKTIADYQITYESWWLNRYVRLAGLEERFRKVVKIELTGPPSFVYGQAQLTFADGTTMNLPRDMNAYRPVKRELEVRPHSKYEP